MKRVVHPCLPMEKKWYRVEFRIHTTDPGKYIDLINSFATTDQSVLTDQIRLWHMEVEES